MITKFSQPGVVLGLTLALTGFNLRANEVCSPGHPTDPPDGTFEAVAKQSGPWSDPNTWSSGVVPTSEHDVRIPSGFKVSIRDDVGNEARFIRVEGGGSLRHWKTVSTRLEVETLFVDEGGIFRIGSWNPGQLPAEHTAEVVFTGSGAIDKSWDCNEASRGFISKGMVRLLGAPKKAVVTVSQSALKGERFIVIDSEPTGWEIGDEIVVTAGYFHRDVMPRFHDERFRVRGITSTPTGAWNIELGNAASSPSAPTAASLAFDHHVLRADMPLHMANLTRNIIFRSQNPNQTHLRGHVMFMGPDVIIQDTAFVGLGRTDKSKPLDDLLVEWVCEAGVSPEDCTQELAIDYAVEKPAPQSITNRRARYSLHFHKNNGEAYPTHNPSMVANCVVRDAIGWGFVNHSSYVHFVDNIAYDFVGAAFVAEEGDELGRYLRNIAIRGHGADPTFEGKINRIVFGNAERKQPLGDFGFLGEGFWVQGPAVEVWDNIATSCGTGFAFFPTGMATTSSLYTPIGGSTQHNQYSSIPAAWVNQIYAGRVVDPNNPSRTPLDILQPRRWRVRNAQGQVIDDTSRVVIGDLPQLPVWKIQSYGNYIGLRLRFSNQGANDWYREKPYQYTFDIKGPAAPQYQQTIDNLRLWNNQQAFRMRYTGNTKWTNVVAVNQLSYDFSDSNNANLWAETAGHNGAEMFFFIGDQHFEHLIIEGYPVAGQVQNAGSPQIPVPMTFGVGYPKYSGYVNLDSWASSALCARPYNLRVEYPLLDRTRPKLRWSSANEDVRHSVRYREEGSELWTYVKDPVENSVRELDLNGLTLGQRYRFQVIAGCEKGTNNHPALSRWSLEQSFEP